MTLEEAAAKYRGAALARLESEKKVDVAEGALRASQIERSQAIIHESLCLAELQRAASGMYYDVQSDKFCHDAA